VDVKENKTTLFRESVVAGFDPSQFATKQVFYTSKDGTKVPMFIVSRKEGEGEGKEGKRKPKPTFLYGYGGFNISLSPSFSVLRVLFCQNLGGTVAVPNIRGGGEYGEEWHKAGSLARKQNVFDDFVSAANYLIAEGYTTPAQLAINGGSNGGLLVCACINQQPQLFGAAVAAVGVLDMLRFHKFTIGYAWCSDYGSADNKDEFEYLIKYSPYHTIEKGKPFPATLLTTADHDDRVVPLHSFKYISELQYKLGSEPYQTSPLLIRIECKAGHGAGKPLAKTIEEQSDVIGFIAKATGAVWQQ
jgi:prolyl oligopeptidase